MGTLRHRESPSLKVTELESDAAKAEILTAGTQHPPGVPAHSPPLQVTNRDTVSEENELATGRPADREGSVTGRGKHLKGGVGSSRGEEEEQERRGQSAVPSGRPVSQGEAVKAACFRAAGRGKRGLTESPALGTGVLGDLAESAILGELGCPPEGRDRGNRGL